MLLSSLHLLPEHGCRYTIFLVESWLLIHVPPTSSPHMLTHPAPQTFQLPSTLIFSIPSHLDAASWSICHCQAVNELISDWFPGERELRHLPPLYACAHVCVCASTCELPDLMRSWRPRSGFMKSAVEYLVKVLTEGRNLGWKQPYQRL